MEWPNCKFIASELALHQLCAIDNNTGRLLGCFPYPLTLTPTAFCRQNNSDKLCISFKSDSMGNIYIVNTSTMQGYKLPIEIPSPLQFTATPDLCNSYFTTPNETLYHLNMTTLELNALAQPENAFCCGLTVNDQKIFSVWETTNGHGIVAIFNKNGELDKEIEIRAIPTNIAIHGSDILIPFSESSEYGEGFAVINHDESPRYITIHDPASSYTPSLYPCSITIDDNNNIAYLIHENGGSISIVDTSNYSVHNTFSIGRSISNIYLLPDTRFALATSNMFADLTLLDLVNHRLLSVNDSSQEFSNLLTIID